MVTSTKPDTFWMKPAPLWASGLEECAISGKAQSQPPLILRFVTDSFMDEFNDLLTTDPERLAEYRAQPETWRGFTRPNPPEKEPAPMASPLRRFGLELPFKKKAKKVTASAAASSSPLKLYQPAQQRFYLVTSSLICDSECLPDRPVNPGQQERVGFVIRRLWPATKSKPEEDLGFPDSTWKEHAFIAQEDGAFHWNLVEDRDRQGLQKNEEMLSMFPVSYASGCHIHGRRVLAGLIPVGRREAYMGAMALSTPAESSGAVTPLTARKVLFRTQVSEPWKALVDTAVAFDDMLHSGDSPSEGESKERLKQSREQIQTISWLTLADLRRFLEDYNQTVWAQVAAKTPGALTGAKLELYDALLAVRLDTTLADELTANMVAGSPQQTVETLADALRQMGPSVVNKMESSYEQFVFGKENPNYPAFLFPLVDLKNVASDMGERLPSPLAGFSTSVTPDDCGGCNDDFDVNGITPTVASIIGMELKSKIDKLAALVVCAMDDKPAAGEPVVPLAAMQTADLREGWFVIRCVYIRPLCPVHTTTDTVSLPSEPFQMAGFFDPEAPARPVRIGLPLDTTPSGLRKFSKNTAFVISDVLCGQIKRIKGITFGDMVLSVLPWPFHKNLPGGSGGPCKRGGVSMGMICSLSIPIITLCAFILLMVMVTLFDFIFRWLPYFFICFPVPGLRAKKD